MQIVFTEPPPRPGGPSIHPWAEIAEQLKARPNEWALCLRDIHISATTINRGALVAFKPAGAFQARTVGTKNKDDRGRPLFDLYIMYVGEPDQPAADKPAPKLAK